MPEVGKRVGGNCRGLRESCSLRYVKIPGSEIRDNCERYRRKQTQEPPSLPAQSISLILTLQSLARATLPMTKVGDDDSQDCRHQPGCGLWHGRPYIRGRSTSLH